MAQIKLTDYKVIDEGRYVFIVDKVEYKEEFGKMNITCKNKAGYSHIETYNFLRNDGTSNPKALGAFTFFARTILNDFEVESIDDQDIVGHYFIATVEHDVRQSTKDATKTVTFVHLVDYEAANSFDDDVDGGNVNEQVAPKETTQEVAKPVEKEQPTSNNSIDLDDLLG